MINAKKFIKNLQWCSYPTVQKTRSKVALYFDVYPCFFTYTVPIVNANGLQKCLHTMGLFDVTINKPIVFRGEILTESDVIVLIRKYTGYIMLADSA